MMQQEPASIGKIFSASWEQYKRRWLPILAVILISTALIGGLVMVMVLGAAFGGALLAHLIDERTALYAIITLAGLLGLLITILALWCQTAMLAIVVDEQLGIIDAFQTGWSYLWPMAWVMTILSGILITGLAAGLFPCVLFMVWFAFCPYILLDEDRRGLDALLASREYVRGRWGNTFAKLLLIWLLSAVVGLVPFAGQLLSIILAPFVMLYLLTMYRDLKNVKGEEMAEGRVDSGGRIFWGIIAGIGLLLPLLVLAGAVMALLGGDYDWMEHVRQSVHGRWL